MGTAQPYPVRRAAEGAAVIKIPKDRERIAVQIEGGARGDGQVADIGRGADGWEDAPRRVSGNDRIRGGGGHGAAAPVIGVIPEGGVHPIVPLPEITDLGPAPPGPPAVVAGPSAHIQYRIFLQRPESQIIGGIDDGGAVVPPAYTT